MKDTWQVVVVLAAALVLAVTPAAAQEESGVSCDPAQPGETMSCTATGLEADSEAQWTATFGEDLEDDPVVEEGTRTADGEGVAEFDVEVPEDVQAGDTYEVQVTGDDDYDESTQGVVVPADDDDNGNGDGTNDENEDETASAASAGVSCGEPVAGQTLTCEAAGLEADSEAQWAVFYSEDLDTADQGSAVADAEGVATFDIDLIDDAGAPYGVRVTGTAADGGAYDETLEGVIVAAQSDDDPVPDDDTDDGDADADADDDQVSPTPKGGADAGLGGTAASSGPGGPAALLAGLVLLAAAAVASRNRDVRAMIRRRLQELRARV